MPRGDLVPGYRDPMDRDPREDERPAPPVSPDGTHWWNGREWVPMPGYEPLPMWRVIVSRVIGVIGHVAGVIATAIALIGLVLLVILILNATRSNCVAFC